MGLSVLGLDPQRKLFFGFGCVGGLDGGGAGSARPPSPSPRGEAHPWSGRFRVRTPSPPPAHPLLSSRGTVGRGCRTPRAHDTHGHRRNSQQPLTASPRPSAAHTTGKARARGTPAALRSGYVAARSEVQDIFNKFGRVVNTETRGRLAVITFASPKDATAAIENADGAVVNGIKLKCTRFFQSG